MANSRASARAIAAPRTRVSVGTLKGGGRIEQQIFLDTYTKVGFAKLYDRKTPITAADLVNDRVIPFFEAHAVALLRVSCRRWRRGEAQRSRHPTLSDQV
jgi:hypothetical protein